MNRVFIKIGPINIYWYSIIIMIAVLIGIYLSIKESKHQKMKPYIENLIFETIIFGIIGARIYYVIFNFPAYKNNLIDILKIWEGGLAIYGGIIGGLIAIIKNAIKKNESILKTIDIFIPSLILGQAIGRWGNFFNKEAHGIQTTLEFLKKIHIPNFIIKGMHINNIYYHPTFLYESIWCIIGFIIIIIIRKLTKRRKGIVTYTYCIWYGLGRFFIESIRTDSLYIASFKISQIISIILVIIGVTGIITLKIKNKNE